MVKLRNCPGSTASSLTETLGHDQWLLAQISETDVEFRHAGALAPGQEQKIGEHVHAALDGRYRCRFATVDALPLTSGGKRHFTVNETLGAQAGQLTGLLYQGFGRAVERTELVEHLLAAEEFGLLCADQAFAAHLLADAGRGC